MIEIRKGEDTLKVSKETYKSMFKILGYEIVGETKKVSPAKKEKQAEVQAKKNEVKEIESKNEQESNLSNKEEEVLKIDSDENNVSENLAAMFNSFSDKK